MKVSFFETARYCAPEALPSAWPVPSGAYDRDAGVQAYRSMIERLEYVEELGFDWVSVSEHQEMARRLYAHPERLASIPPPDPVTRAKTQPLVQRLRGPDRDADLESRLPGLAIPTLVLFGTLDSVIAPAMGRVYKELMPSCHLVFVYDAAHAINTDRPEAFAEVVADFLERHEAFVISRTETVIHP